jgi:hypothetical protein
MPQEGLNQSIITNSCQYLSRNGVITEVVTAIKDIQGVILRMVMLEESEEMFIRHHLHQETSKDLIPQESTT